jgi:hypothetical protein
MNYQQALRNIDQRYQELAGQIRELCDARQRLEQQLKKMRVEFYALVQMRDGIAIATGQRDGPGPTLAGCIRALLNETDRPLTPVEICEFCQAAGIRASSRRN